jgi:hypothetical protein
LGGAAAFNHAAATPNRAVRMAGRRRWPTPRDYLDDRISNGRRNETHSLSLIPPLRVNSGTAKQKDRPSVAGTRASD